MQMFTAKTPDLTALPRMRVANALLLACLPLTLAVAGCAREQSAAEQPVASTPAAASQGDIPDVLATIGDQQITMKDIRARVGDDLDQLEVRYQLTRHRLVQTTLDQILHDQVLQAEAQKEGKSVEDLVVAEAGPSLNPTDVEISTWYDENKARLGGRTLDQVKSQIADYLRKQRHDEASERLQQRLNKEKKVTVFLQPYRLHFNNQDAPKLGPDDAPVKLVEFSDFQCPYCGRFFPTLKQLEQKFGDQLQVIYRQYPIASLHPNAPKAAEASLCAKEQGKFWQMHDLMFQEQDKLSVKELKEKAARLGMDQKKFDNCLDSGRYVERVQEDEKEGSRSGVTGTPAIFLNGVSLPGGAVSFDVAAKAIQKEIDRDQQ